MIFVVWLQQKTLASYPYYKYDEKLRELNKFQVYNNLELSSQNIYYKFILLLLALCSLRRFSIQSAINGVLLA